MSTVVIRSRNKQAKGLFNLSDDARRQAKEYLKSAGYDVERIQPLIWPDDAVSAYREHGYAPWQFTTKADVRRKRQEDAKHVLWFKREYGVVHKRALYVWVFFCPGINNFFFRGWYTYLEGVDISCGVDRRDEGMISKIMELFPLVEQPLFGQPNLDEWMKRFVKKYRRGTWCGKPQGKSPVWAEVQGSSIKRLLGRAEWPGDRGQNVSEKCG